MTTHDTLAVTRLRVPGKASLDSDVERRWGQVWDERGLYAFDRSRTRDEVYAIDTPPPTVSGSLHIGHVFSYTHIDLIARYQRMRGRAVFFPMGWDDNGLPTERRVQNYYGVRCDPSLPYDPSFVPPDKPGKQQVPVSRRNFIELCEQLTLLDEQAFEELWRRLGLSIDWSTTYRTIDDRCRTAAQLTFLRRLAQGDAYQAQAPSLWDTTYQTAVAQAELEDRAITGAFYRLRFATPDGEGVLIDTTRPELLPACVALVCHPDDERYRGLVGSTVATPLFGVAVPVRTHRLADPDKGTGIAMVCTFGDVTDAVWWRELQLETRTVITPSGRIAAEPPAGIGSDAARSAYGQLAGLSVEKAQAEIVRLLAQDGALVGEPRRLEHAVKFYERGDRPLQVITTRQWYIRNGARDEDLRAALKARGSELSWHPGFMEARYQNWVDALNSDWLISRQRFFGVPIPVWYPLDEHGDPRYDRPLVPAEDQLPIDPASETPPGYTSCQRGKPGGFVGDPDVMDTWATSALTPLIAGGWERDPDLLSRVYPMDLRPQAHEIIRTWLFVTILRSHQETGQLPWRHALISGWILDPDRKKMSKSKGNVLTPMSLLEKYGSDGARYWAANGRPGTDTAFDEDQMKVGRRLALKLLNVTKFVLGILGDDVIDLEPVALAHVTQPIDKALLARLADTVDEATGAFDGYDYARALAMTEDMFWPFCDDYVELVKNRAYGEAQHADPAAMLSARAALVLALRTFTLLFAPTLAYATEEAWSWWHGHH
ncbi:MAG: valine--tRNA ligase, partial [Pseudonocardiaceae bacterium]